MSSKAKRQMFVGERNFDIGRIVTSLPIPEPYEIMALGNGKSEYIYEFKNTGCKWAYIVNDSTSKVESWHYVSDPDLCFLTIDWFAW